MEVNDRSDRCVSYFLAFFSALAAFFSLAVLVGNFFFSFFASLDFMVRSPCFERSRWMGSVMLGLVLL